MLNRPLLVLVLSRLISFILTGLKIIIFIQLSVKRNYFILFIIIIFTHNYLSNTPAHIFNGRMNE